ncbi:hypothetical protein NC239_35275 [Streptomyces sp. G3]|uniref:hypothetical protein n=1 Tax=Streptomyces sp. G3 TaxID=690144 RepID=UPI00203007FF|nr:hypothetical protein [Streptomyces sp. G3]MCM1943463.1 hypothetical protein [Streptomyces sp. G3]
MTDHALRLLRQDRRLAELAAFPFGFDLDRAAQGHVEEVCLASGGPLETVAGDDTGGTYFVCADGSVLYADSEGAAGIIGPSVDEALELLIGLPGWRDYTGLSPDDGEEKILACAAETEDGIREYYGIDEERAELRAALGFPERSPVELVGRLRAALLRTEPDFVLSTRTRDARTTDWARPGPRCGSPCSRRDAPISPACGRATPRHGVRSPRTRSGAGSPFEPRSSTAPRAISSCYGICCGTRHGRR